MAKTLLKYQSVQKGDIMTSVTNGATGAALGVIQQTVEDNGTQVMGRNLGEIMPAIELAGGLAAQFQKNSTLRSIGQIGITIGAYEVGRQNIAPKIGGMTRSFKKTHKSTVPRAGGSPGVNPMNTTHLSSLYA